MKYIKDLIILNIFVVSLVVLFLTKDHVIALFSVIVTVSIYVIKHIKLNSILNRELKTKIQFFEALLNSSTDVVVYQDKDLKIIACNKILCDIHKKTKDDVIGKDLKYLFQDNPKNYKICELMEEKLVEAISKEETVHFFGTVYEEEPHYYNILVSPTYGANNKLNGTILVARNVTKEYKASKNAQEKEKQLKCILENIPICAFLKGSDDRFIAGSSAFEKILKFQKNEEMRQLVLSDIFQEEYLDFVKNEEAEIYRTKKPLITERLIAFPNQTFWGRVCKAPVLDDDGNVEFLVIMYENIEAEKEIERQKEYFIETLIHDLKVPTLAQLRGLELLQNETLGSISLEQKELVSNISESCKYILTMISMVLNTYRFENGRSALYYEDFDLSLVVVECCDMISRLAKEKNIKFKFNSAVENTFLEADKEEIKKVIINLLTNAITYSNKNECVTIEITSENNSLKLSVTSKGISLSNRECLNLFERSSESNPKYTTVGHGISLYLCKKIIDTHNGKIFASTDGNMTNTFSFVLPQSRPKILPNATVPMYI